MKPATRLIPLALSLAACLQFSSHAQSSKITLRLENVTAAEAVTALGKAAAIPLALYVPEPGQPRPPEFDRLEKRYTFDWNDVSVATALRALTAKYQLGISMAGSGGYQLTPAFLPAPGAQPAKQVGLIEKKGMRLWVKGVRTGTNRMLRFEGDLANEAGSNLSLDVACLVGDGDAGRIDTIENVAARDDRGNLLLIHGTSPSRGLAGANSFPDEWNGTLNMSGPHPRATKLQWVEGDVLTYRTYQPFRLEVPLSRTEKTAKKVTKEASAQIIHFDQPAPSGVAEGGVFPGQINSGPTLKAQLVLSSELGVEMVRNGGTPSGPLLVGASGKFYAPNRMSSGINTRDEGVFCELDCGYPSIDEPIEKAVFPLVRRSDPEVLFTFRMTNIPLPPAGGFAPPQLGFGRRPSRPDAPAPPARPFEQKGGGILVTQVRVGPAPAGEGTLSLGLSQKNGEEWGPVRWQEGIVEKDGSVRLEEIKPGTYRLLRIYRPKEGTGVTGEGAWQNTEVQIVVFPGKETTIPPLAWSTEVPSAPKPAVRPKPVPRTAPAKKR